MIGIINHWQNTKVASIKNKATPKRGAAFKRVKTSVGVTKTLKISKNDSLKANEDSELFTLEFPLMDRLIFNHVKAKIFHDFGSPLLLIISVHNFFAFHFGLLFVAVLFGASRSKNEVNSPSFFLFAHTRLVMILELCGCHTCAFLEELYGSAFVFCSLHVSLSRRVSPSGFSTIRTS